MSKNYSTVLLLEDQPLTAIDLEDLLLEAGFTTIKLISSCESAEEWLQTNNPHVAVIDINLRDGKCENVAKTLVDRNIPFLVHTGSSSRDEEPSIFHHGRWMSKPSSPESIVDAVRDLLAGRLPLTKQA